MCAPVVLSIFRRVYTLTSRLYNACLHPGVVDNIKGQEYAWEFHGDYQGLIAYIKELEKVLGDKSNFLPITNAEIVKDGEYIFKGSTNKQRFINNSKQE